MMLASAMASSVESQSQSQSQSQSKSQSLASDHTTEALAEQVDTVALVTITHVSSLVNRGMSFPGLLSVEAFSYQLNVNRLWKGGIPVDLELKISLKNCAQPLRKGETYLVFGDLTAIPKASRTTLEESASLDPAVKKPSFEWVTKSCDQVIPESQAQPRIVQLNQLYPSRTVAQYTPR